MDDLDWPSPNFDSRDGQVIDMLVLHYTGMQTLEDAAARLMDPKAKVSAHYLVAESGDVSCLVDEQHRAWHAGVSSWRGKTNINARSIGIEIENPGHEFGYRPFPDAQMAAVIELSRDILQRHPIPARNVVGHSDVAPTRKQDPGELFDWPLLAQTGIGLWPFTGPESPLETLPASSFDYAGALNAIGYETKDLTAALLAFQRHFCRTELTGTPDSRTQARLRALLELFK